MSKHYRDFEELVAFLRSKKGLKMSHVYKPLMLLGVLDRDGKATKYEIAQDFALGDSQQVEHYRSKVVHKMPGVRLVRDGLLTYENNTYQATGLFSKLDDSQKTVVRQVLRERIDDYVSTNRYPFGDSNNDAVRGSVRYEVLRRAGGRCELCGISSSEMQIDVDHIIPRSKGGSNDLTNLQALCRTCNAQKRNLDDSDFHALNKAYSHRAEGCIFCNLPKVRIKSSNLLALSFEDLYPVTELHTLIIPRRHICDYADATQAEVTAMNHLLQEMRESITARDSSVTGFNIGVNCGADAGQTVFHAHMHLIPRRKGDVPDPRGGVRHLIPGKGHY